MPSFTFARGNAKKLLSLPLYAAGRIASALVPRRDNLWVFASGAGFGEGSRELYRHARAADPSLALVWLARNKNELRDARRDGVTAALRSSWRGFRLTLRARVLVVTHGLGDGQRFGTHGAYVVQLWHGIPLKRIQLDSPSTFRGVAPAFTRWLYRRSTAAFGLVPAASELSATRLRSAFGIPADRVVVTGDPRDDVLFHGAAAAVELLRERVGDVGRNRVILFAPTWRDGDPDPVIPTEDEWRDIAEFLEQSASVLIVRPHPHSVSDYDPGAKFSDSIRMLPAQTQGDITPVLPAVDVLVTDYSSIAFDFAVLSRPIAFLAPDVESYAATRGLYEPYDDFSGGTHVSTWLELLEILGDPARRAQLAKHAERLAKKHHEFLDGRNAERVYSELRTRLGGHT